MNRSPYLSPLGRAADMDVGGAADLQTDIMRFMAILALCLVAIFALVQSIPLQPTASAPVTTLPAAKPRVAEAKPEQTREPTPAPRPEPETAAVPEPAKVAPAPPAAVRKPTPMPKPPVTPTREAAPAAPTPPAPAATPETPEPEGFTLRFASDSALTRLVARNEIGLYAITPERALRMSMNRGSPSFWPASAPNQFHEMDAATVPDNVRTALRRAGTLGLDPQVQWGVTLPPGMRRQLDRYLSEHTGGELVIEATGNLRLES